VRSEKSQKKKGRIVFAALPAIFSLGVMMHSKNASADIRDAQSLQPIAWEPDFTAENTLSLTWLHMPQGLPFLTTRDPRESMEVKNIFGLQLGQTLREDWHGRVGLSIAREGSRRGEHVWSFVGSDLQFNGLIPKKTSEKISALLRPSVYFGLGVLSRWENSITRYNLIPTARYEASEPAAYGGVALQFRIANEMIFELDSRYFQSARVSVNRGISFGGSLVWGAW
jgi:hypothetical protein